MPGILRDIIEGAVARQPDMLLIDGSNDLDVAAVVKKCAPHVVIVADAVGALEPSYRGLLVDNPRLKIIVVTDDGRSGQVLEFRRSPVAQMSPQGLIAAIRAAAA